jgi:uncharacterized membrane protein
MYWGLPMGRGALSGIDKDFQDQVRDLVKPGISALFLVLGSVAPDKAAESLSRFGGTVLASSLSEQAEAELQEALHGSAAPDASSTDV